MIVMRRNPENRLAKLLRKPGGKSVADALKQAEDNLKSVEGACLETMDATLAELSRLVAKQRSAPSPDDLPALYDLSGAVLETAGVFGMGELSDAAFSLCELVDRFISHRCFNMPALDVHMHGLNALRVAAGAKDAQSAAVLDGLRQVVARVTATA